MATILIEIDDDLAKEAILNWYEGMAERAAHAEIAPLLVEALQPLVASERAYLGSHNKSGALSGSLAARSGSGDRPGTVTAFSSPTATVKDLKAAWGSGRAQQRRWAKGLSGKGRRKIFYGNIVHQGHKVMRRGADGALHVVGKADPVPFAQQAVDALGEQAAEAAAEAITKHVIGE
jgi:hypothetical protein